MPRRSHEDSLSPYEIAKLAGEPATVEGCIGLLQLLYQAHKERRTHDTSAHIEALDLALRDVKRQMLADGDQVRAAMHIRATGRPPQRA